MSKRVPLVGDELAAYEEEQNRKKQEEALKATLIKEEESKAVLGAELPTGDPMVIDSTITRASSDGIFLYFLMCHSDLSPAIFFSWKLKNNFTYLALNFVLYACLKLPNYSVGIYS